MQEKCRYCSNAHLTGICEQAVDVYHQSKHGGLTPEDWVGFLGRMKEQALPQCLYSEKLREALQNAVYKPPED